MTIYLHIGTEKTGSTYIQNFLSSNRLQLLKQGFQYPKSPGLSNHTKLPAYAQEHNTFDDLRGFLKKKTPAEVTKFRRVFKKQLLLEVKKHPAKHFIFSSEHCSSRLLTNREIARLRDLLGTLCSDMKVIIYLRRQDQFFLSTYSTWIKSGATGKLKLPPSRICQQRYDFAQMLDRWADVFGKENLIVRPYDNERFTNGDLLSDFAHSVGFEVNSKFATASTSNKSLDAELLEYLRQLNFNLPGLLDDDGPRMRAVLLKHLTGMSSKTGVTLDGDTMRAFLGQFEESNEYVQKTYLKGNRTELFPPFNEDLAKVEQTELSTESIIQITSQLWLSAYQEIQDLKEQVQKMKKKH